MCQKHRFFRARWFASRGATLGIRRRAVIGVSGLFSAVSPVWAVEKSAVVDFSVAPTWYQTTWFLTACVVAFLLAVVTIYRLRVRQVGRTLSARFDERLAERTRIARELHDTLLQTIQGSKLVVDDALEQPDDSARLRRALEQVSEWLQSAIQEGRAAYKALDSG